MVLKPNQAELERLFDVLAEQMEARLAALGFEPGDEPSAHLRAQLELECFESIHAELIMPEFAAALYQRAAEVAPAINESQDGARSPQERMTAHAKVQAACDADPLLKAFLLDSRAALVREVAKLREQFRASRSV